MNILNLPIELQSEILSYLSCKYQIIIIRKVCKLWFNMLLKPPLKHKRYASHTYKSYPERQQKVAKWQVHRIFGVAGYERYELGFRFDLATGAITEWHWRHSDCDKNDKPWGQYLDIGGSPFLNDPVFYRPNASKRKLGDQGEEVKAEEEGFITYMTFPRTKDDPLAIAVVKGIPKGLRVYTRGKFRNSTWILNAKDFASSLPPNSNSDVSSLEEQVMESTTIKQLCESVAMKLKSNTGSSTQYGSGKHWNERVSNDKFLDILQRPKLLVEIGLYGNGERGQWILGCRISNPILYSRHAGLRSECREMARKRLKQMNRLRVERVMNDPLKSLVSMFDESL